MSSDISSSQLLSYRRQHQSTCLTTFKYYKELLIIFGIITFFTGALFSFSLGVYTSKYSLLSSFASSKCEVTDITIKQFQSNIYNAYWLTSTTQISTNNANENGVKFYNNCLATLVEPFEGYDSIDMVLEKALSEFPVPGNYSCLLPPQVDFDLCFDAFENWIFYKGDLYIDRIRSGNYILLGMTNSEVNSKLNIAFLQFVGLLILTFFPCFICFGYQIVVYIRRRRVEIEL